MRLCSNKIRTLNFFICILSLLLPHISSADDAAATLTTIGQTAPDVTLKTLDGGEFRLSELRGQVVLLNFFATWCSPCLAELPHLELDVWQKFNDDQFMFLAIGRGHTKKELVQFSKIVQFTFPMAPDPKWDIYGAFATRYIPRTVLIDQHGKIIYHSVGYSEQEFAKMIRLIETTISSGQ